MKLSVIICIYNTDEGYFEKCLRSITESTLFPGDYEILVIDDGSDKDYSSLIEKYSPRVIKTENRGIFLARLLGIKEARGEYIAFVDSDDTVSFNYHFPMLKAAYEGGLDIVFNDWAFHTERTRYTCLADSTISRDFIYTGDDALLAFARNEGREHSYFVLWNKLFRKELLTNEFDKLISYASACGRYNYSEDALISFYAFKNCKKCANIHTGYYFYCIHDNQNVNITGEERLVSHINYMSGTLRIMFSDIGDNKHKKTIEESIKNWAALMSRTHYSHARANKLYHLYDFIKESYGVERLSLSKYRDSSAYSKNQVLPMNIEDIDRELLRVWRSKTPVKLSAKGCNKYMLRSLKYMKNAGHDIEITPNGAALPKPRRRLRDIVIMHKLVYTVGLVLFKKGSRIRAFLKKHI